MLHGDNMVTIRFSVMFNEIRNGHKKQTIRLARQYKHLKEGAYVHCYSTKKREGIRRPVTDVLLYRGYCISNHVASWGRIKNRIDIAKRDGFFTVDEMREWFETKYPYLTDNTNMRIIRWI